MSRGLGKVQRGILECIRDTVKVEDIVDGEIEMFIDDLVEWVYDTKSPTHVQYQSVYRAVTAFEKKGFVHCEKKTERASRHTRVGERLKNTSTHFKSVYAYVANEKIVTKDGKQILSV